MEDRKQVNWEKEYYDTFTKKIPFPIITLDCCKFNPVQQGFVYTLSTISINRSTRFELYTQKNTKVELENIVNELKNKKRFLKQNNEEYKTIEDIDRDLIQIPSSAFESKPLSTETGDPHEEALLLLDKRRVQEWVQEQDRKKSGEKLQSPALK